MVDSFDELKQIFINHFMIQTDILYSTYDLYTIWQLDDESLHEYTHDSTISTLDAKKLMNG